MHLITTEIKSKSKNKLQLLKIKKLEIISTNLNVLKNYRYLQQNPPFYIDLAQAPMTLPVTS